MTDKVDEIISALLVELDPVIDEALGQLELELAKLSVKFDKQAIQRVLRKDLEASGKTTVMLQRIRDEVLRYLGEVRQSKMLAVMPSKSGKYKWVAVLDKRTCPECASRHGLVKTLEEWEQVGMPNEIWASGGPTCEIYNPGSCRCYLVPVEEVDESLDRPIFLQPEDKDLTINEFFDIILHRKSFDRQAFFEWLEGENPELLKELKKLIDKE